MHVTLNRVKFLYTSIYIYRMISFYKRKEEGGGGGEGGGRREVGRERSEIKKEQPV